MADDKNTENSWALQFQMRTEGPTEKFEDNKQFSALYTLTIKSSHIQQH
jgi:hypothetical protein